MVSVAYHKFRALNGQTLEDWSAPSGFRLESSDDPEVLFRASRANGDYTDVKIESLSADVLRLFGCDNRRRLRQILSNCTWTTDGKRVRSLYSTDYSLRLKIHDVPRDIVEALGTPLTFGSAAQSRDCVAADVKWDCPYRHIPVSSGSQTRYFDLRRAGDGFARAVRDRTGCSNLESYFRALRQWMNADGPSPFLRLDGATIGLPTPPLVETTLRLFSFDSSGLVDRLAPSVDFGAWTQLEGGSYYCIVPGGEAIVTNLKTGAIEPLNIWKDLRRDTLNKMLLETGWSSNDKEEFRRSFDAVYRSERCLVTFRNENWGIAVPTAPPPDHRRS